MLKRTESLTNPNSMHAQPVCRFNVIVQTVADHDSLLCMASGMLERNFKQAAVRFHYLMIPGRNDQ